MKLWHLKPREGLPEDNNPWESGYNMNHGFVVRAKTEQDARSMANEVSGDENFYVRPWLMEDYSDCVELTDEGEAEIIITDYAA